MNKQTNKKLFFSAWFILLGLCPSFAAKDKARVTIGKMLVEYETAPLGIDVQKPRFSWQMLAPKGERGCVQTAFRIQVKDDKGALVWDSGKRKSASSLNIAYGGSPLKPATYYEWTLSVWNNKEGGAYEKRSSFETGLMSSDSLYAG